MWPLGLFLHLLSKVMRHAMCAEERGLSSLTNASKVDFRMVPAIRLILTWTNNNVHVALSHTTSARYNGMLIISKFVFYPKIIF
ncbi:hypothetical protein BLOT_002731 [Blomia tropicalis]|nr:hypothetical protein BLOT_002731 [Blomia tropicalis]